MLVLSLAGCAGPTASPTPTDPGPVIPPASHDEGWDDDDVVVDDDTLDDDDALDDDDDTLDDDDLDPPAPLAPCGPWVEPGPEAGPVSTSSGAATLSLSHESPSWAGCEIRRVFDASGGFACEDYWQVTGHRIGGAPHGDVYRLDFTWVDGLSSCPDDGADFVVRYAVQPLPEQELNLYRSEPEGEPLWSWITRGDWQPQTEALGISYWTSFVAWP